MPSCVRSVRLKSDASDIDLGWEYVTASSGRVGGDVTPLHVKSADDHLNIDNDYLVSCSLPCPINKCTHSPLQLLPNLHALSCRGTSFPLPSPSMSSYFLDGHLLCPRISPPLRCPQTPLPFLIRKPYRRKNCLWAQDIFHVSLIVSCSAPHWFMGGV